MTLIPLPQRGLEATGIIDAVALAALEFPDPRWVVPGYIPEGLTILAGRPKIGKSWLALGVADAVSRGGMALGKIQVEAGDVLALCLEDNRRRLQGRLRAVWQDAAPSARLHLSTDWPRLDEGGIDRLADWLSHHPSARMVVVDTFAKVRGRPVRDEGVYQGDYAALAPLKSLADEYRVGVVALHHLRKSGADDPLDEISGSTGLTGAADGVVILKRDRSAADGLLFVTGRDVEEQETALQFDAATGAWLLLGDAAEHRQSEERRAILRVLRDADGPMTPREVAAVLGKNQFTIKNLMAAMFKAGAIMKPAEGRYEAP